MTHHWAIYFLNATAAVNYYSLTLSQQYSRLCSPSTGCNFAPRAAAESLENSSQESLSRLGTADGASIVYSVGIQRKREYNRDYTITCPPRPSTSPLLCIRQNNIYRAPPSGAESECCLPHGMRAESFSMEKKSGTQHPSLIRMMVHISLCVITHLL